MPEQYRCHRLTPGPAGRGLDAPWEDGSAGLEPRVAAGSLSDPEARSCSDAAESSWQE